MSLYLYMIANYILIFFIFDTYQFTHPSCTQYSHSNSTYIGLRLCESLYTASFAVGNLQQQQFNLLIDTGSNILWVPINKMSYKQDYTDSTLSNTLTTIYYGDQSWVKGFYVSQNISNQKCEINIKFSVMIVKDLKKSIYLYDGMLGLGFKYQNIFDVLLKQQAIFTNEFVINLMQQPYGIYFNVIPNFIKQSMIYAKMFNNNEWVIQNLGFVVNQFELESNKYDFLIDSGTQLIFLQRILMRQLMNKVFNRCWFNPQILYYQCPQNFEYPILQIYTTGIILYIYPKYYSRVSSNKRTSYLLIHAGSTNILGNIFFKGYMISFNKMKAEIGFYGQCKQLNRIGNQYFQNILLGQYSIYQQSFIHNDSILYIINIKFFQIIITYLIMIAQIADIIHIVASILLLLKLPKIHNIRSISLSTQKILLISVLMRFIQIYIDSTQYRHPRWVLYCRFITTTILLSTCITISNLCKSKNIQNTEATSIWLYIIAFILFIIFPKDGILWSYSVWLGALAFIPQIRLVQNQKIERVFIYYVCLLLAFRLIYVLLRLQNVILPYMVSSSYYKTSLISGLLECIIYIVFIYRSLCKKNKNLQINDATNEQNLFNKTNIDQIIV